MCFITQIIILCLKFMLNVYGHYNLCCFMCKIPKFYFNGTCSAWFIAKSIWPLSATWNVHGGSHFEIVPWRKDGSILKYFWCWCVDKWQQCSSKEQNKLSVQRNGIGSMNFMSVAIWQQSTKRDNGFKKKLEVKHNKDSKTWEKSNDILCFMYFSCNLTAFYFTNESLIL